MNQSEHINGIGQSENINELAPALSLAQGSIPALEKNKRVKIKTKSGYEYTYGYADLAEVRRVVSAPLKENGLSILFRTIWVGNIPTCLEGKIIHSSGQWMSTLIPLLIKQGDNPIQEFGSASTYARRYGICSLLNLSAEDDDDGIGSSGQGDEKRSELKEAVNSKREVPTTIQPGQVATLQGWLKKYPEEKEKVFKSCAIERLEDMAWKDFPRTLDYFKKLESKRSGS